MRHTPQYLVTDPEEVRRLVRRHPWATFVSHTSNGLVASHYPVLLEESATDITLLSHVGRPDDELHERCDRRGAELVGHRRHVRWRAHFNGVDGGIPGDRCDDRVRA